MNNRLTIQDLAGLLADYTGKDKQSSERFLREFLAIVSEGVFTDKLVKIKGIGTFKIIPVEKRESIHVNTGERFLIPAHYKFSFLPDKELREQVNKPFSFFETTELQEDVDFTDLDVVSGDSEDKEIETESVEEVIPEEKALPMEVEPASELSSPEENSTLIAEEEPITEVTSEQESEEQTEVSEPDVCVQSEEEKEEPVSVPSSPEENPTLIAEEEPITEVTSEQESEEQTEVSEPDACVQSEEEKEEPVSVPSSPEENPTLIAKEEPVTEVTSEHESEEQTEVSEPDVCVQPEEKKKEIVYIEPQQKEPIRPKRSYKKSMIALAVISLVLLLVNLCLFWKCDFFTHLRNTEQAEPTKLVHVEKNQVDTVKQEVVVDTLVVESAKDSITMDTIPKQVEKPVEKRPEVIAEVEIKRGSRLTMIALKYYGHKLYWVYIYEYNKAIISDPNNIPIGTVIKVPAPEIYNINKKNRATLERAATRQTEILNELAK